MNDVIVTSRAPVQVLRRVHSYNYEPEAAAMRQVASKYLTRNVLIFYPLLFTHHFSQKLRLSAFS